jgi:ribosomal protein S18 acetylase RimI-like enzyme
MAIEYKWLDNDSVEALDAVMIAHSMPVLNRHTTRVRAAYDGDRLVGFLVLQLFPHMEPIYVDPEYRGNGISKQLVDDMYEFMNECQIRGFMCMAESPNSEKICQGLDMTKIEIPVYIKL